MHKKGILAKITFSLLFCTHIALADESCNSNISSPNLECVQFVSNYDGDTITVNIEGMHHLFGHNIPVRVRSIYAPEIKGRTACENEVAQRAKSFVTSRISTISGNNFLSTIILARGCLTFILASALFLSISLLILKINK